MFHHYHGTCWQPIQYFSTRTEVEFFGQKSTSGISLIHQKTLSPHTKLYTRTPFLYYLKISEIIYIQYRLKRTPKTKSDFSFYYFTYVELSKPNQSKLQGEDSKWPFYNTFLGAFKKELLNFEKCWAFLITAVIIVLVQLGMRQNFVWLQTFIWIWSGIL